MISFASLGCLSIMNEAFMAGLPQYSLWKQDINNEARRICERGFFCSLYLLPFLLNCVPFTLMYILWIAMQLRVIQFSHHNQQNVLPLITPLCTLLCGHFSVKFSLPCNTQMLLTQFTAYLETTFLEIMLIRIISSLTLRSSWLGAFNQLLARVTSEFLKFLWGNGTTPFSSQRACLMDHANLREGLWNSNLSGFITFNNDSNFPEVFCSLVNYVP